MQCMENLYLNFFENETDEFGVVLETMDKFDRLLKKVTFNQRVFLNTLKEIVDADISSEEWFFETMLFSGYIELYDRANELIPDAPIDTLKKYLPEKKYQTEFYEMIAIMEYWVELMEANKKPSNQLILKLVRLPELIVYGLFVAVLVVLFVAGLNIIQAFSVGLSIGIIKYILLLGVAGYFSVIMAKTVILKINLRMMKLSKK